MKIAPTIQPQQLADCHSMPAILYQKTGRYEQAESAYRKTVELHEQIDEADVNRERNLVDAIQSLTAFYVAWDKIGDAADVAEKCVVICEHSTRPDLSQKAKCLYTLAMIKVAQREVSPADTLFARALQAATQAVAVDRGRAINTLSPIEKLLRASHLDQQADFLKSQLSQ
jgi:tetratricopeptide (TPR) repeat protein